MHHPVVHWAVEGESWDHVRPPQFLGGGYKGRALETRRCDAWLPPLPTMLNLNAVEKQQVRADHSSSAFSSTEKASAVHEETTHDAATRGHLATDSYVEPPSGFSVC